MLFRSDSVSEAIITTEVSILTDNRINNLHFQKNVALTATACITFTGCRFDTGVTIASGGKAQFIGCTFKDSASVNNSGVAANVYIIGCVKSVAATHTNATIISEVDV